MKTIIYLLIMLCSNIAFAQHSNQPKNVNNGTNYGSMHVGDNINVVSELQLSDKDKQELLNFIEKIKKDSSTTTNHIKLLLSQGGNAGIYSQIKEFLAEQKYVIYLGTHFGTLDKGVNINYMKHDNLIEVIVGYF